MDTRTRGPGAERDTSAHPHPHPQQHRHVPEPEPVPELPDLDDTQDAEQIHHGGQRRRGRGVPGARPDTSADGRAGTSASTSADATLTATAAVPHATVATDLASTAAAGRSGEDTRQRGWFWHWNNVVTQYAPLIGLTGVGLLNSYTVWTDRRDASPHRGYAFPSQQAESAFYGEDRAELITINKILVALDLIEIRKEMLQRTDAQGRRWRVPHNLYRVKDRPDGVDLRVEDVLNVVALAQQDAAVFRYLRRVFSPRFAPIDRSNVWHSLLPILAQHPTWQELAARTVALEERASARTRAGHRSRARNEAQEQEQEQAQAADDTPEPESESESEPARGGTPDDATQTTSRPAAHRQTDASPAVLTNGHFIDDAFTGSGQRGDGSAVERLRRSAVAVSNDGCSTPSLTAVADSNAGWGPVVAQTNRGLNTLAAGSAAPLNSGSASIGALSNTMYDQTNSTTNTTTTNAVVNGEIEFGVGNAGEMSAPAANTAHHAAAVTRGVRSVRGGTASASHPRQMAAAAMTPTQSASSTSHTSTPQHTDGSNHTSTSTSSGAGSGQADERITTPDGYAPLSGSAARAAHVAGDAHGHGHGDERQHERTPDAALANAAATDVADAGRRHAGTAADGVRDAVPHAGADPRAMAGADHATTAAGERDANASANDMGTSRGSHGAAANPRDTAGVAAGGAVAAGGRGHRADRTHAGRGGGGPLVDPSALVVATFEAANGRSVSGLERELLAELERDADHAARAAGSDGATWLVAAMREAVGSGSTFVAPKRIREIVTRWAREGAPVSTPVSAAAPAAPAAPAAVANAVTDAPVAVRLPGGANGDRVWAAVLRDLGAVVDPAALERLLGGSRIVRYARGEVLVQVADAAAAEKVQREFHGLIERHLNQHLRRPVGLAFAAPQVTEAEVIAAEPATDAAAADEATTAATDAPAADGPLVVSAREAAAGGQLWAVVLQAIDPTLTRADRQVLAGVVVLGVSPAARLLVGAPSSRAAALLAGRYRAVVSSTLAGLLGQEYPLELLPPRGWRVAAD